MLFFELAIQVCEVSRIHLASMEANEEKIDVLSRQVLAEDDRKMMQGYEDRSKVREVLGTRTMRELILK